MTDDPSVQRPWWHEAALPVMLQVARRAYAQRIRRVLAGADMADLPRHGARVIGGLRRKGAPVADVAELGVPAPAVPALIDSLVALGYVERAGDAVALTARGRAAAELVEQAIAQIDGELATRVGPDSMLRVRRALAHLMQIADAERAPG